MLDVNTREYHIRGVDGCNGGRWTQDLQPGTGGVGKRLRVEMLQDDEIPYWWRSAERSKATLKQASERAWQRARDGFGESLRARRLPAGRLRGQKECDEMISLYMGSPDVELGSSRSAKMEIPVERLRSSVAEAWTPKRKFRVTTSWRRRIRCEARHSSSRWWSRLGSGWPRSGRRRRRPALRARCSQ